MKCVKCGAETEYYFRFEEIDQKIPYCENHEGEIRKGYEMLLGGGSAESFQVFTGDWRNTPK